MEEVATATKDQCTSPVVVVINMRETLSNYRLMFIWQVFPSHNIFLLQDVFLAILEPWLWVLNEGALQMAWWLFLFEVFTHPDFFEPDLFGKYSWLQEPPKSDFAWKCLKMPLKKMALRAIILSNGFKSHLNPCPLYSCTTGQALNPRDLLLFRL